MMSSRHVWGPLVLAMGAGCAGTQDTQAADNGRHVEVAIQDIDRDLTLGDRGSDVEAVYRKLLAFGYFPDPELWDEYPHWVPVVEDTPQDPSYFGPELDAAVSEFQERSSLAPTGRVDVATRAALEARACAYPDSADVADDEKWSFIGAKWTKTNIRWKVTTYPSAYPGSQAHEGLTTSKVDSAIKKGFAAWAGVTNLTFTQATNNTFDIEFKFYPRDQPPAGWDAHGAPARSNGIVNIGGVQASKISIHTGTPWWWASSVPNPPVCRPTSCYDFQIAATHEIGHSLGLNHSALDSTVMYGGAFPDTRAIAVDDNIGIGALYHVWKSTGANISAVDIGANGIDLSNNPRVWAVSNFGLWKYDWTQGRFVQTWSTDIPLTNVAVNSNGVPWITDNGNSIYEMNLAGTSATNRGQGRDIALAPDGSSVWAVSNISKGGSNYAIAKWSGSGSNWFITEANGYRLTVDASGKPWVVRADGSVWRQTITSCPEGGTMASCWEKLPGSMSDIGATGTGSMWAIGGPLTDGGAALWIWNEQAETSEVPELKQWAQVPTQGGLRIAGDWNGEPWITTLTPTLTVGPVLRRARK